MGKNTHHCLQASLSGLFFSFNTVSSVHLMLFSRSKPTDSMDDSPISIPPPNVQIKHTMRTSFPLPALNISFREELVYIDLVCSEKIVLPPSVSCPIPHNAPWWKPGNMFFLVAVGSHFRSPEKFASK